MSKKSTKKSSEPISAKELGKFLYQEFNRDKWGTVDPDAFKYLPKSETSHKTLAGTLHLGPSKQIELYDEEGDEMAGLYEVVDRVARRINQKFGV